MTTFKDRLEGADLSNTEDAQVGGNQVGKLSELERTLTFMGCQVIISKDAGLWHMSISRKDRLPSYEELKSARYQFFPDVPYMVQIFPPKIDFVNAHDFCLHLWQPKDFIYSELNIDNFLRNKLKGDN